MHKDKEKPCRFFVVPIGGTTLMGMPGVKMFKLLNVNCNTTQPSWKQADQ